MVNHTHTMTAQRAYRAKLVRLCRLARQVYPGLSGRIGCHQHRYILLGQDNRPLLNELYHYWRQHCPEAGQPYWAVRSWTMLCWQPICLAVLAVHGVGSAPNLCAISQRKVEGTVAGFRLTDTTVYSQPQTELIARTGRQLRQLCDGLLAELMQVVRIRPLLARRLVADRVLSVLSRLGRWLPTTTNAQISAFATAWLAALDLTDASGLMPITLADGQVRLALQRKACCFDYRRAGGKYCATCPKQPLTTRIQRLQQQ